jgi:hypothetical protein
MFRLPRRRGLLAAEDEPPGKHGPLARNGLMIVVPHVSQLARRALSPKRLVQTHPGNHPPARCQRIRQRVHSLRYPSWCGGGRALSGTLRFVE